MNRDTCTIPAHAFPPSSVAPLTHGTPARASRLRATAIGVVVIGRNEGERLGRCLSALCGCGASVVYVDSGSTDDSVTTARNLGVDVHVLDPGTPYSAARARNEGLAFLLNTHDKLAFVQFVDGDCVLDAAWLDAAQTYLEAHGDVAAVCGRLHERHRKASIYHRLCDIEWDGPAGEITFCGGTVMMRVAALHEVGGFDPGFFAGEEPELCLRLNHCGWRIHRLPTKMATHEAGPLRFAQWWRRALRSGDCFARLTRRHGRLPRYPFHRQTRSPWWWAGALPAAALALVWHTSGASLLAIPAGYLLLAARIYLRQRRRPLSRADAALYAGATVVAKFPQLLGQLRFHMQRARGAQGALIEYKRTDDPPRTERPHATRDTPVGQTGSRAMRIVYALGPGDVVEAYRRWRAGEEYPSEVSITFSSQFFELCRTRGWRAWAISSHPRRERVHDGGWIIENRPKPLASGRGFRFHLSQLLYGLSLVRSALRFRADAVIVDSGTTHWFVLALPRFLGTRVIASLHNVLWPSGFKPAGTSKRCLLRLDGWFWRRVADATVCVSPECRRQVIEVAGRTKGPIVEYRALYRAGLLDTLPHPPPYGDTPLRVLFAGRIEANKGVFDLLAMADLLERRAPGRVRWEVCGTGGALEELRRRVAQRGLADVMYIHGHLERGPMRDAYARCHLVIVPTRSDFREGLPRVAAEAVLAGRPALTSRLANARDVLGEAVIEAEPENVASYVEAIRALLDDPERYRHHQRACRSAAAPFYDPAQGLAAALARAIGPSGPTLPQTNNTPPAEQSSLRIDPCGSHT